MRPRIFLDCDGVLADFDTLAEQVCGFTPPRDSRIPDIDNEMWRHIEATPDFFGRLPLMPDALELVAGVSHLRPSILTGCPANRPWVREQKARWTVAHFPDLPVTMCRSKEKANFCSPGDVLIDDWTKYRDLWRAAGGIFIHHTDAKSSLLELRRAYPNLFDQVAA